MLKVIVADDNSDVRRGLREVIQWEKLGAELVLCAHDGKEVIDFMKEQAVDLVISDIKMPVVNGIELNKHINANYPGTAVIILSAYADFTFAQEALHYGAIEYILKPIDPQKIKKLSETIKELAEQRRHSADLSLFMQEKELKEHVLQILQQMNSDSLNDIFNLIHSYKKAEFSTVKEFYRIIMEQILSFSIDFGVNIDDKKIRSDFIKQYGETEIKIFLTELYNNVLSRLQSSERSKSSLAEDIIKYVDENCLNKEFNVGSVAEYFKLSVTYVGVVFKKLTQQTLSEYIYTKRMEKARELLKKTVLPISAISDLVGYEDRDYFTKIFKKYTGTPPGEYRQKNLH